MKEKRIYVVVAETVQHPLVASEFNRVVRRCYTPDLDAISVVQPKGRLAAQVGHAVGNVRHQMLFGHLYTAFLERAKKSKIDYKFAQETLEKARPYELFTTIVLGARDSLELQHIKTLMLEHDIKHVEVLDTNQPDYGSLLAKVRTAIATHPMESENLWGVTDYLPLLWKDEVLL